MESRFVYTILATVLFIYIYNNFKLKCESFGISTSDQQKLDDYKDNQGNIVSIINIYNKRDLIRTNYSINTNIMKNLDMFKTTVTPIWNQINSIRNAWVNYKNDTGGTAQSVQIANELNTQYDVLVSLKTTVSNCAGNIKKMIDNSLPEIYRTMP